MNRLADEIAAYIEYLKSQYGLNISLHPKSEFSQIFSACSNLAPYNSHLSPYCTVVKKTDFEKCIKCQRMVIKKCENLLFFTGECHAGVMQYIHTAENDGTSVGFISVSGYAGKKRVPKKNKIYEKTMIHNEIPTRFLNTVISPLARMFGMLIGEELPLFSGESQNFGDFERIKAFVNEYHTTVTLDMVCKNLHLSKSYVSHTFKKHSGYTLKSYCNILKVNDAKKMLKISSASVTEIALASGFENISYFISVFKKQTGVTPLVYRNGQNIR